MADDLGFFDHSNLTPLIHDKVRLWSQTLLAEQSLQASNILNSNARSKSFHF